MILSEKYGKIEILFRYPLGHIMKGTVLDKNELHLIKMFNPPVTIPEELYQDILSNLEQESNALRKTRSQKILRCLYSEREINALLVGFPYPEITPVSRYVRENHPLSPSLVLNILEQLRSAFSMLLSREIHRFQLEPDLIFINPENHKIVYLDTAFVNLAKFPEAIRLGYLDGRPQFLPPELLKTGELGASSQVYLFAVFAHYLLSGSLIHNDLSPAAAAALSISEPLPPVNRFRDNRESELNKCLYLASERDFWKRTKTVDDFVAGLKGVLSENHK